MEDTSQEDVVSIDSLLNDCSIASTDPLGMSLKFEGDKGMKKHIETATRSPEWISAASTKLNTLMRSLISLARHSHFQVRRELLFTVKFMLSKCSRYARI